MQPASTVIVLAATSTSRMRLSRDSDNSTSEPPSRGVWPPTWPVLPDCGTIAVPVSLASAMIAETSSTVPGFIRRGEAPK